MIGQSLSNTNETCYSVQIAKICNLNKAQPKLGFTYKGSTVPSTRQNQERSNTVLPPSTGTHLSTKLTVQLRLAHVACGIHAACLLRVASTMGKLAVGAVLRAPLSNEIVAYGV